MTLATNQYLTLAVASFLTFVVGFFILRASIRLAHKWKLVDVPSSRRRHSHPMPIIGGVTLFLIWGIGIIIYSASFPSWAMHHYDSIIPISISLGLLIGMGLLDDLKGTGPILKLSVQFVAAFIVMYFEPHIHGLCYDWSLKVGPLSWIIAALWLVGLSNAINLIDGLDGLAGGTALLALFSLFVLSSGWGFNMDLPFVITSLAIPALAAFLMHNWHPSKIFLGDNGSLPLGFLIGTISLMYPSSKNDWIFYSSMVLMMGYPILDMGLCSYRRYRYNYPIFKADRNHLHHRILRLGMTVPQTALLLLCVSSYLQLAALSINLMGHVAAALFIAVVVLSLFTLLYLPVGIERTRVKRVSQSSSFGLGKVAKKAIQPQFKECTVADVDLSPLFEVGLFEEKERLHELISSLKLMLRTLIRKDDVIYQTGQRLTIVFMSETYSKQTTDRLHRSLKEKLTLFQEAYNLQYSLAGLPVKFEKQEFLFVDNEPQKAKKAA